MFAHSKHIGLRAAEPTDAQLIYRWENDQTVWRVSDTIAPFSMHHIEQFILQNNDLYANRQLRMMIDQLETRKTVGCIDLYDFDPFHERAGVGIMIEAGAQGQGLASQALLLLEDYAFGVLQLNQLFCLIGQDNEQSIKLFVKSGYIQCGLRKSWLKTPKGFIDQVEFQRLNPSRRMIH
jgi:diamine N-acetyltransferase